MMKLAPVLMSAGQIALKEERIIPRDTGLPFVDQAALFKTVDLKNHGTMKPMNSPQIFASQHS